jgi:hypothetical protein
MFRVLLWSSAALAVALAIAVIFLAADYAGLSHVIQANQITMCLSGNKTRAESGHIISEIAGLLPRTGMSAAKLAKLQHDITANYDHRDKCG